jgi:hypothetical protein
VRAATAAACVCFPRPAPRAVFCCGGGHVHLHLAQPRARRERADLQRRVQLSSRTGPRGVELRTQGASALEPECGVRARALWCRAHLPRRPPGQRAGTCPGRRHGRALRWGGVLAALATRELDPRSAASYVSLNVLQRRLRGAVSLWCVHRFKSSALKELELRVYLVAN